MAAIEPESMRANGAGVAKGSLIVSNERFVVPLLIFLFLTLSLVLAFKLNIWVDEAFSLLTTEKGVGYALRQALNFELQAPLYFLLLSLWRKLDSSVFFARLFSIASVGIALRIVASLSTRFLRDLNPGWLVAVVAFNPLTIAIAVDVRLYALVLLLSALLLLTFYDGYLAESTSRRARICYVILAIAALYTQYYTGFLLAGNAVALLVLRRRRSLVQYLTGMLVVGLCFTPMLPFIRYQMSAHTAARQTVESWFELVKFVTWRIKDYILPPSWDASLIVRSWILRVCYAAAAYILFTKRRNIDHASIANFTITLVVAFCFLIAARLSGEMLLQARHTVVFFLPVTIAAFSIVALSGRKRAILIWTIVVLAFSLSAIFFRYKSMAKSGDWHRVADYLMAVEKPEQPIMVFHAGAALPLQRYYAGKNVLVPLPKQNTFERFDFNDYVVRDEREITAALERAPGDHQRVWLVTDGDCGFADLSYHCEIVEAFVNKNYKVEETRNFHESVVRLLVRKPGP